MSEWFIQSVAKWIFGIGVGVYIGFVLKYQSTLYTQVSSCYVLPGGDCPLYVTSWDFYFCHKINTKRRRPYLELFINL